jgi:hypothetical protein
MAWTYRNHARCVHANYARMHDWKPQLSIAFTQWLLSFVDDSKMFLSFQPDASHEHILNTSRQCLQTWQTLLNITGGALELPKCVLTLQVYSFEQSYKAKRYRTQPIGIPRMLQNSEIQGTCMVELPGKFQAVDIRRQEPSQGLDSSEWVRAAADGNFIDEYTYRLNQSKAMAGRLAGAPFNPSKVYQVYSSRFKPAVGYCLPITTFSDTQCNNIQSPFYQVMLPKSGMNRHMPKAVIHGPTRYGGLQYTAFATEQIASHVSHLIGLRRNDLVSEKQFKPR